MKVWIVTIGEPIINNKNDLRIHRHGLLANYISTNSSNEVVWWTSLFNHFTKEFEFQEERDYSPNPNLTVKLIKGCGYKNNVSISRIRDHYIIKKKFSRKINNEKNKPDIIICSFPTLGLCEESIRFGKANNIPVLIDYRDLWPEAFQDLFPKKLSFFSRPLLAPLFYITNKMFNSADGIIGITENFLQIALDKIKRKKNDFDAQFPHTYNKLELSEHQLNKSINFWKEKSIKYNSDDINICFFGTLGYQFDLETVIKGFNKIYDMKLKLIICGSGHNKEKLIKLSNGNKNIIFPGYMNGEQIKALLSISHIGLCPYLPKKMFIEAIPGKIIEYMSEGLYLLSTLKGGVVGNLIEQNNFGANYNAFDEDSFIRSLSVLYKKIRKGQNNKLKIEEYYQEFFDQKTVFKKYLSHIEKSVTIHAK
tara:strand:- start:4397 stop:5662 length:1266 start_codon:yes stop_codon:yes gene_type:complete